MASGKREHHRRRAGSVGKVQNRDEHWKKSYSGGSMSRGSVSRSEGWQYKVGELRVVRRRLWMWRGGTLVEEPWLRGGASDGGGVLNRSGISHFDMSGEVHVWKGVPLGKQWHVSATAPERASCSHHITKSCLMSTARGLTRVGGWTQKRMKTKRKSLKIVLLPLTAVGSNLGPLSDHCLSPVTSWFQ